ncbi:Aegerolysin family protein [Leucogyrophana mollusca]|uniref:Aegerolysin family protein n=1 Tax=Leucogyrophana mollusca TaxID=85980 RepID=A0ACB8BB81_9AGAM|nr:Aegerolysin family protein [Leucogyrophana mollusca]
MAIAQFVVLRVKNSFRTRNIKLQKASLKWGKFHEDGNKDNEIEPDTVNGIVIPAGATGVISACGRSDASSGTEGTVDLYDDETKICTLYWNCPWGSKTNNFAVQGRNSDAGYMVSVGTWNRDGGALGHIDIEVAIRG